jgi:hypothetical protein
MPQTRQLNRRAPLSCAEVALVAVELFVDDLGSSSSIASSLTSRQQVEPIASCFQKSAKLQSWAKGLGARVLRRRDLVHAGRIEQRDPSGRRRSAACAPSRTAAAHHWRRRSSIPIST